MKKKITNNICLKKNTYIKGLLIFQFILLIARLSAQTNLPSTLACNEILTITGSPYIVDSTITIEQGCALTVNPGVEIKMAENTHLIVKGKVDFLGTVSQRITIHAKDTTWGNIFFDSTNTQKSTFNYVTIENARNSLDINQNPAAVYGYYSALEIKNCNFQNNLRSIYIYQCPNTIIKSCVFDSTNFGEKILAQYCDGSILDSCILYFTHGDKDAIDFDASKNVTISNNYIYGGDDDAIDIGQCDSIGCDGVTIEGNYIYNMFNKGVSNGEYCTNINLNHNVIIGCGLGIGAKSGAVVIADHNTLYNNRMGINSYHHYNQIWGPGHLTVTNCIIAGSDTTYHVDTTAFLAVSYSLSTDTLIPGTGNIMADPMFIIPVETRHPVRSNPGNYHLMPSSPAINNGDPNFAFDPDGSRSDIGRYYLGQTLGITSNKNPKEVFVYPNPSNGIFILNLIPNYHMNQLIILNSLGQVLHKKQFYGDIKEYPVDLNSPAPGIYYMQLVSENNTSIKKIVIY